MIFANEGPSRHGRNPLVPGLIQPASGVQPAGVNFTQVSDSGLNRISDADSGFKSHLGNRFIDARISDNS